KTRPGSTGSCRDRNPARRSGRRRPASRSRSVPKGAACPFPLSSPMAFFDPRAGQVLRPHALGTLLLWLGFLCAMTGRGRLASMGRKANGGGDGGFQQLAREEADPCRAPATGRRPGRLVGGRAPRRRALEL